MCPKDGLTPKERSNIYRLERDHTVVVFDEDSPNGALCSDNGHWPTLFNEDEANDFVSERSERHPDSQYRIFKLIDIGLM